MELAPLIRTITPAVGTCDYPVESDVRFGISYAFGTLTGTLFVATLDTPEGGTLRERGHSMFKRRMRQSATRSLVTVIYSRGVTTVDVSGHAWVARTVFSRRDKEHGPAIVFGDRDYIVAVTALPWKPARGDRITETENAVTTVFEVIAPAGEPEWRYSDPSRTHFRVHTKEVKP